VLEIHFRLLPLGLRVDGLMELCVPCVENHRGSLLASFVWRGHIVPLTLVDFNVHLFVFPYLSSLRILASGMCEGLHS
jgi:hypothetical protein